jgi:hypothetical protein
MEWAHWRNVGVIVLTPFVPSPDWDKWTPNEYNPLHTVSTHAHVDGILREVIPVKVNDAEVTWIFDTEKGDPVEINRARPAMLYFMGNDDWSYGLRFETFEERDRMLNEFGEELGFMRDLQGHN